MRRTTAIGPGVILALALMPGAALAQEASPEMPGDDMSGDEMMAMVAHPSHIHTGVCPAPGDVIAGLSDVAAVGNDAMGVADSIGVEVGLSTVELALDDILAADHAIVVHHSAADMGTYIACGNIGGHDVDGSFLVGLGPVGTSGYSGIAWLTDNGDGTTDVQVAITQSGASESMAMDDDMSDDSDDDDSDHDDSDDDS